MPEQAEAIIIEAPMSLLRGSQLFQPRSDEERQLIQSAIALCAFHEARGDTCVPLAHYAEQGIQIITEQGPLFTWTAPALDKWIENLLFWHLINNGDSVAGFVIDNEQLYFHRLFRHERDLAAFLHEGASDYQLVDVKELSKHIGALFPNSEDIDWQLVACLNSLSRRISIINGGPGTGKTTTIARLLALLFLTDTKSTPHIQLAAPTGKAASRMAEALRQELDSLKLPKKIKKQFPSESSTLHRLYKRLIYEKHLPIDCLIIDEASMADISTLNRCLQLLPKNCRVIFLGDPMQLCSVESGSVLMDICASSPELFTADFNQAINAAFNWELPQAEEAHALAGARVALKKNWRFEKAPGICALSQALLDQENTIAAICKKHADCELHAVDDQARDKLIQACLDHFLVLSTCADAQSAIEHMSKLGILSAWKSGSLGVHDINSGIDQAIRLKRGIRENELWYHAKPFMVQANNYDLGLYNGDVGIVWNGRAIIDSGKQLKDLPLEDIAECLPLYAMSIHKSQGSQYDHVHVVIPDRHSEHLSRSLLYTGITRAKQAVAIWSSDQALEQCIKQDVQRYTGLPQRLTQ